MYKTASFKKKLIATAIASTAMAGFSVPAFAQEGTVEEVVVTGIRASLERAMDIKRESSGVVDAISAEDIGKFPDTNLAESLQRITGVSINRTNGEGSQVTVRGFGAGNNMITLNGRMMPAASAYGGGSGADPTTTAGGSRAFDFANLASESVSGVEVYKTSKANIATGGIGATINIKTQRPLDNPGLQASVGVKAVMDTTNRTGDDITPEIAGLFSWTDDSEVFGVGLTLSSQERHSGLAGSTVNNWTVARWNDANPGQIYNQPDASRYENAPADGQLYSRPNDVRYAFSDIQRERTNGQLTLQFAPSDLLTATVDYTYARNEIQEHRGENTAWVQNGSNIQRVVFDDSEIATPLMIVERYNGTVDEGFEQQWRQQENTLESFGANFEFKPSDRLTLTLDVHDSSMESLPVGPGGAGEVAMGIGAPVVEGRIWGFSGTVIPLYSSQVNDSVRGNNNGVIDAADMGTSILRVRGSSQVTDITQVKFDGSFEFDEGGRFDFGVETRAMESASQQTAGEDQTLGNWGVADPGIFAGTNLLENFNYAGEFDNVNMSESQQGGLKGNPVALAAYAIADRYPDAYIRPSDVIATNDNVQEDTEAVYFQVALQGELGGMETNVLAGVRYETTDVTSTSLVTPPVYHRWNTENDFSLITLPGTAVVPMDVDFSYDNLLPSLDIDIAVSDDVKARFSYSKTIARAAYNQLRVSPGGLGITGSTLNGTIPRATSSNPRLLPLESDNLDVSVEWYFDDASYLSAGVFEKRVTNFIGQGTVKENHFGIQDQTSGPRALAARAALQARGFQTDDANLYRMMVLLSQPGAFPGGADEYDGSAEQGAILDETIGWDLFPAAGDPLMIYDTSAPVNDKEAKIYGAELAVQHFFGDSGFGVQANYTIVRGDIKFTDLDISANQFALLGLSDTANLSLIYEAHGLQARLAANWRDEYLRQTNRGSNNPSYVEAYTQIDLNVTYEINDNFQVFAEGLNLTGADIREHGRNEQMMWNYDDMGARYNVGARYKF
jgi:TonB-dependent receptor